MPHNDPNEKLLAIEMATNLTWESDFFGVRYRAKSIGGVKLRDR